MVLRGGSPFPLLGDLPDNNTCPKSSRRGGGRCINLPIHVYIIIEHCPCGENLLLQEHTEWECKNKECCKKFPDDQKGFFCKNNCAEQFGICITCEVTCFKL